jgi:hypothetical protein
MYLSEELRLIKLSNNCYHKLLESNAKKKSYSTNEANFKQNAINPISDVARRMIKFSIKEYNRLSIKNLIKRKKPKLKEMRNKTLKNEFDNRIPDKKSRF